MSTSVSNFLSIFVATNCSKLHKNRYIQCCNFHPEYDIARGQPVKQVNSIITCTLKP